MRQAVSRTQMWVRARMPLTLGLVPYMGDKGDKNAARPPEGSLVETRCLIKGPKSAIVPFPGPRSRPKSRTGPGARCWYDESAVTHSSCRMNMEFFCKKMSVAFRYFFKPAISWRRLLVPVLSSYFWPKCFVNIINFNSSFSFSYNKMSRSLERKRA